MKEEDVAEKSEGTEIVWKEGKNITKKTIKKVRLKISVSFNNLF